MAPPPPAPLPPASPLFEPVDQAIPSLPRQRAGIVETILIGVVIALLMAGEIAINKPRMLFDGPFQLDECLTASIVSDTNIGHSIDAVRHGVDTNPPVYHLILRAFWMGVQKAAPHLSIRIGLRGFSLLCTWLALVGAYIILRKGFGKAAAFVAALAIWAHPVVVEQSTDARFYGPLLFATVLMLLALQIRGSGIIRGVIVALCAMLLCTLHYFGILMLGSLVLAMLLVDEAPIVSRIIRVLPTVLGPLALLPFIPFIRAQAQGLTVRTWVDPFTFHTARDFALGVLCPLPLLIALAIWAMGKLLGCKSRTMSEVNLPRQRFATVPLLFIALVPAIIIAFSATVQSALIPRYAVASGLVLAGFVALLAQNRSATLLVLLAIALSGYSVLELHSASASRAGDMVQLVSQRDELIGETPPLPIAFADRAGATQLQFFAPDLLPRISLIDQRQPGVDLRNFRLYEIEMVGKVSPYYTTPPLVTPAQLAAMGRFHLIANSDDMKTLLLELPLRHISGDIYEPIGIPATIP
jgi:uncharacterized membrane protein